MLYPGSMPTLVTTQELATWSQTPLATVEADPFATEVLEKASGLIREIAKQPTWEIVGENPIPFRARMLALKVVRRTYVNPDQEISSTTGPISSRVADEAAMAMTLSDEDIALLESLQPGADEQDGLWTLGPGRGPVEMRTAFIPDDSQPNLVGEPWAIPYGDTRESDFFNEPGDEFIP